MIFAKDFIETAEGLIFAVVEHRLENGKVLCFLRYVQDASGWKKLPTEAANAFLKARHPAYLHYSHALDADIHAVPQDRIATHHQPRQRLQAIMQAGRRDGIEQDLSALCKLLQAQGADLNKIGVTGSLLIGAQNAQSDIDLVCYQREGFFHCQAATRELIRQGKLRDLSDRDWQETYRRRSSDFSFTDYVWHERRKANKGMINGRKFDLACNPVLDSDFEQRYLKPQCHQKCGAMVLQAQITDDRHAFDYPAEFSIDHPEINLAVSFTATYTGQAVKGETVEISGLVEQDTAGLKRIVVGSNREAHGEYIKVLH